MLITTTILQATIGTNLSAATRETKVKTTPNEAHGLRLHHLLWTSGHFQGLEHKSNTPAMRYPIQVLALCAATVSALQLSDLQPFLSAIPISVSDYLPPAAVADRTPPQEQKDDTSTQKSEQQAQPHLNLFRRQNDDTCPSSYNNCAKR